jgi:hypothetical protein
MIYICAGQVRLMVMRIVLRITRASLVLMRIARIVVVMGG